MAVRCRATNRQGNPCRNWSIPGGMVCKKHGGGAPLVRARAAVRVELRSWGLDDATADPGETLLRLLTQSVRRAQRYAQEIERLVEQADTLSKALVGESYVMSDSGDLQLVGDYIRGMAQLENQERDRAAKYSQLAIAAGLAERQVRLAERSGAMMAEVMAAVLEEIGVSPEQRALVPAAIERAIMA